MSDWISVKDRVPEREQMVLVYGSCWNLEVYPYRLAEAMGEPPEACFDCPNVTHWMPLPKPPSEVL